MKGRELWSDIRKMLVLAAAVIATSGCATHYQPMMNSEGHVVTCQNSGWGLITMLFVDYFQDECVKTRRAEGFREIRFTGAIGLDLASDLTIASLVAGGPAEVSGLRVGDVLLSIDGKQPYSLEAANGALAGATGTKVQLAVGRKGANETFVVLRKPWLEIYPNSKN